MDKIEFSTSDITSMYSNELVIEESDGFMEVINTLTQLAINQNCVFRGYSIQDQLYPNIIRNKAVDIEIELLNQFEKYGMQYMSANTAIDFMSYAQHFGLSTRLLDFTYNPFIALYFSLFKAKPNNAKIDDDNTYYYIRYCNLGEQLCFRQLPKDNVLSSYSQFSFAKECFEMISTLEQTKKSNNIESIKQYIESAMCNEFSYDNIIKGYGHLLDDDATKFQRDSLIFVDINQSNQRLIMQQGLFLFPYTLDKSEHFKLILQNTKVIKIHKSLRNELQAYLNVIGINAFRIMPDLPNVCEAVERMVKETRQKRNPSHFGR